MSIPGYNPVMRQLFPSFGLKNIAIYYWLGLFLNGWFILPNWVFYFNLHINKIEIGWVEGVAVLVGILMEVPSGVLADLLGKRRTIIAGSLFLIASCLILINATQFIHFLIGNIVMFIGFSFQSGATEAFAYDSLKEKGKEANYDTIVGKHTSITIAATLLSTLVGGYLFSLNPSAPFVAWAIFLAISCVLLLFTTEPGVDTVKFNLNNYLKHLRSGVSTLFGARLRNILLPILAIPVIIKLYQGLVRQSMADYFGYTGETFGYLFALVSIPAIIISFRYSPIRQLLGSRGFLLIILGFYAVAFGVASVSTGLLVGGGIYLVINIMENLARPLISSLINERIDSKHRATTISTLSLFSQIPYVVLVSFFAVMTEPYLIDQLFLGYTIFLTLVWIYSYFRVRRE